MKCRFWGQKIYFQKAFAVSGNDKGCKTLQSNIALVNTPFALVNTTTGYGCKRYSIAMIDCFLGRAQAHVPNLH